MREISVPYCTHCEKLYHIHRQCYDLHPELRTKQSSKCVSQRGWSNKRKIVDREFEKKVKRTKRRTPTMRRVLDYLKCMYGFLTDEIELMIEREDVNKRRMVWYSFEIASSGCLL